jgi:membrane protein DedA with SNARE-associated domain
MINHIVSGLAQVPAVVVYLFVLAWLAAESCGVPLPNEVVLLLTGSLAAQPNHPVSTVLLIVVATTGSLAGAEAAYAIGKRGGRAAVLRFGRRFRLDEARLNSIEAWFDRSGAVAIFLARITPFVRTIASFPAGMLRLPQRTFVLASLAGSLIWCTVMVVLGDIFGRNYTVVLTFLEEYTVPAIILLVALGAGYFWLHGKLAHVGEKSLSKVDAEAIRQREKP